MSATAVLNRTERPVRVILYEGAGSRRWEDSRRLEILTGLLKLGFQVSCTGAQGAPGALAEPPPGQPLLVAGEGWEEGLLPQGVVIRAAPLGEAACIEFLEISDLAVDAVVDKARRFREAATSHRSGDWKPWFPVIDFQRCTNCMQCLSFCLFDVYGVDAEKKIQVKNPDKCKTNCPACSRVCPEVAILFPKYGAGPINGAPVLQEDVQREKMKVDISALLGGDIYSMLRERHQRAQSRFSKERDEGKALKERLRCLKELQGELKIPDEVLMALPSLQQIQDKARLAHRLSMEAQQSSASQDVSATP
jgi:NAD-dependent dihydropyrimidine dehydrogenase PreA subunit